ncbi:hypothetical protein [Microbulbifer taiwanensis]|uniref:hypothetical protein n=1 Tax=Microbulbifer taiwanensis TaxID=986746 RepID=UPI00360B6D79
MGASLDDLEWDVKAYFALGGAVHDAAIAAWGIKGWYDYVRPVSAIRYMASLGQGSDPAQPSYHHNGLPLYDGLVEVVQAGDPLVGADGEHLGKIKLYGWRGPDYIADPAADMAGVGWILAENWWPYQRPTFVTPPFAGYISGHSTFSRAAAETLTLLTGSEYFPGGMGEFVARKNEFLVFEEGPSVDVVLQWATYRDASDQTSLSRIWGGIHPPVDDVPGRRVGETVGLASYAMAKSYFDGSAIPEPEPEPEPQEEAPGSKKGSGGSFGLVELLFGLALLFGARGFRAAGSGPLINRRRVMADDWYFLGIDAGGSRCRARLESADGSLLGRGFGGPANPCYGLDLAMRSIEKAAAAALADAGLAPELVSRLRVGAGVAGLHLPRYRDAMRAAPHPSRSWY